MISLNRLNGAEKIVTSYAKELLRLPIDKPLIGAEFGSAYGGGIEAVGKLWKGKGVVYGFDTFEGHPKQLVPDQKSFEATCMDNWYKKEIYGKEKLSYEYQRKELDRQGLDNVILKKGLITKDACAEIPYLHYALLDMDIMESMEIGYAAVKDKIEPGHLLFLHDVTPPTHIPRTFHWFAEEVMGKDEEMWTVLGDFSNMYLVVLSKAIAT